ncbi:acryloyl-CoA reductase [Acidaminobacter sp. JC074]|uniref:YhdH/YhfP family quinone oxidoreductase n=1 Tax=Acidaminobacter sp. JC074 TaxID=2530199 RepID=UPI001F10248A|nr:YhdH/YhfP family quinone oxidoreductase [Acidaminobacter sp. JC074]MCH4890848.1 acryloyl-CoA reductase [Acidaminobacter sp. JC074]
MKEKFNALVVREKDGIVNHAIEEITSDMLSEGNVVVEVHYSSVNYKDMLAVQTKGGVIRDYPMIPGIDLSGKVVSCENGEFKPGQEVLVTGFQTGMTHTGGYSEYVRVPAEWVLPLPEGLSLREAMVIGTAGFTAALSIMSLEANGMSADKDQEILVTGASGGVGSVAVQLLKASGYKNIHALARKEDEIPKLLSLGASHILLADETIPEKPRVLGKQRFHYILDVVGGKVASGLLPQIYYGGSMSMCGNAGGIKMETTVMPFILRGVNLLGIDSVNYPIQGRQAIWERFAGEWHIMSEAIVKDVNLDELTQVFDNIKAGKHMGRHVLKMK